MAKLIYITDNRIRLSGPSTTTVWCGTIAELVSAFSYTLDCGHSWNNKINVSPKTAASLVSNLNKSAEATCRYYQDHYYSLSTENEIKLYNDNKPEFGHSYRLPDAA